MKKFKKVVATLCLAGMTFALASCGGSDDSGSGGSGKSDDKKLIIWSFTDELEVRGDIEHFKNTYTGEGQKWEGYEVEYSMVPTEDYLTKLLPVLESKKGSPHLFTGELDMIQNFMEAGYVTDLEAIINEDADVSMDDVNSDFVDYIVQSGRDENGVLRGLSWQVTPGGIAFRRDLAVEVWGNDMTSAGVDTSDSQQVADWMAENKFNTLENLEVASQEVKDAGNYRLFVDSESIRHFSVGSEPEKWVIDGKLNPEKMESHMEYMETRKAFYGDTFGESLTANAAEWSGDWFASISGPIQPVGEEAEYEVMAISLPTWGLFHVLEPNMNVKDPDGNVIDDGTFGNWAITGGPNPYFWGGTYLVINEDKTDEEKELAFDFMKSMLFDEERMTARAIDNGDIYARKSIMDTVQEGYEGRESLNYQNHYDFFMNEADKIDLSYVTKYDRSLNTMIGAYTKAYEEGTSTMEEALKGFYGEVSVTYGDDLLGEDLPHYN